MYPVSSCLLLSPRPIPCLHPQLTSCSPFRPQLSSHLSTKTSGMCLFQCLNNQALGLHLKQCHVRGVNLPSLTVALQCHCVTLFPDKKTKVQRYQATKVATVGDSVPLGTKALPFTTQSLPGPGSTLGDRENQSSPCLSFCDNGFNPQLLFPSKRVWGCWDRVSDPETLPSTLPFIKLSDICDLLGIFA